MYRTQKISFSASKTTVDALFALNRLSAEVWNTCLDEARAHHLATGTWIDTSTLQKAMKKRFPMHSQCVQSVCHRYLRAREGAWEARKVGHLRIRYPYKRKRHYPTRWAKDGFTVHPDGRIALARGIWNGKRQAPLIVRVATLPAGTIKEIELVYDRGLKLALSYEDGKQEAEPTGSHVCAIDPGEIHSIAAVAQEIKKVTFGDVEGIQRNTSARRKKKSSKARFRSRKQNQRMSQWTFGKLYAYLAYKLEAMGIALSKQDERYTSQTCPVCGWRKKTSGRTYTCRCGYEQHRDVHGAANQLALVLYGSIQPHPFAIQMPTYLRIA